MREKNQPTVFYGAGNYIHLVYEKLADKYSPVAFCDSDELNWGTELFGLPILSLKEAMQKYPDCLFYVTAPERVKYEILTSLLHEGITSNRILNSEKLKKYKSCRWLETNMIYSRNGIYFCCSDYGRNKSPMATPGESDEETYQNYLRTRDSIISSLNNAEILKTEDNPCTGCYEVKEAYWNEERHIRNLAFWLEAVCNMKCCYCPLEYPKKSKAQLSESVNKALMFLRFLEESKQVSKDTVIEISSGEISAHPCKEQVLAAIEDYPVYFYTNASIFDEKIAQILYKGRSRIVSSLDCGTRETFAQIKGVDIFDRVCANLKKYSEHGVVDMKYIFLPGINDNQSDIEGFLQLCKEIKVSCVMVSRNIYDMNEMSEDTLGLIAEFVSKIKAAGINISAPDWVFAGSRDKETLKEIINGKEYQI